MLPRPILALAAALVLIGQVQAQTPPVQPSPNVVAGVAVMAGDPPKMVSTFPASGAEVAPGVLVLKIAFDQPMTADTWSYAKATGGDYPLCLGAPRLLADNRTFVLLCSTAPGKHYGVAINMAPAEDKAFVNAGDRRSPPFELTFSTSSGEPVRTVKAAMKAAGLGDLDMPVESLGAFVRPSAAKAP